MRKCFEFLIKMFLKKIVIKKFLIKKIFSIKDHFVSYPQRLLAGAIAARGVPAPVPRPPRLALAAPAPRLLRPHLAHRGAQAPDPCQEVGAFFLTYRLEICARNITRCFLIRKHLVTFFALLLFFFLPRLAHRGAQAPDPCQEVGAFYTLLTEHYRL